MFLNSNLNIFLVFIILFIFVYNVSSSPLKMFISEKSEANLKQILGLYDIDIDANRIEQLFPISETELDINSESSGKETNEKDHVRQKRATCDVLSFQSKWISLNHSACAAHCLTKNKKGGRCKDGICICRNK